MFAENKHYTPPPLPPRPSPAPAQPTPCVAESEKKTEKTSKKPPAFLPTGSIYHLCCKSLFIKCLFCFKGMEDNRMCLTDREIQEGTAQLPHRRLQRVNDHLHLLRRLHDQQLRHKDRHPRLNRQVIATHFSSYGF